MAKRSARKPVVVRSSKGADRRAFMRAAYRLMDRAWVRLDERNGALSVDLTPRSGSGSGLAAEFKAAYESAAALRRAARGTRALEAAILGRALELADHVDARRREPAPTLPPEQLAEIAALLAEAEAAPYDPLGLRVPWEELRRREGGS
ncbi:MAG: hypothetical protein KGJ84_17330 [Elusimicrobia bacterium]|nr:hypothetical protein [Elusimicrobiota bacterium]